MTTSFSPFQHCPPNDRPPASNMVLSLFSTTPAQFGSHIDRAKKGPAAACTIISIPSTAATFRTDSLLAPVSAPVHLRSAAYWSVSIINLHSRCLHQPTSNPHDATLLIILVYACLQLSGLIPYLLDPTPSNTPSKLLAFRILYSQSWPKSHPSSRITPNYFSFSTTPRLPLLPNLLRSTTLSSLSSANGRP